MASPKTFFDPFAAQTHHDHQVLGTPQAGAGDLDGADGAGALLLPVTGQGTIAVQSTAKDALEFRVRAEALGAPTLVLTIGREQYLLGYETASGLVDMTEFVQVIKSKEACWLNPQVKPVRLHPDIPGDEITYWVSLDKNNGYIRYGKGFTNKSMMLLELSLKHLVPDQGAMVWNNPDRDAWLAGLKDVEVIADKTPISQNSGDIVIQPLPVVVDLSPFVVATDDITLEELETGTKTVPGNLPDACQVLYSNVSGKNLRLDDAYFPEFSKAIQYSCSTPGCWAFNKLKSKEGEFGKGDPMETYLRITLGVNQGNSPGIPYVLEIWPSGHYSPVHDHGEACAAIKVLHGSIIATYFDSLESPHAIGSAELKEGQITWLGQENYQIHKLHNTSDDVCCTIQCYSYPNNSNKHEDVFNYTSEDGTVVPWPPTSDSTFYGFREIIKREWESRHQ